MTIFEGLLKTSLDKVEPSLLNSYSVGSIEWHAGDSRITNVAAKIDSGNAAFNLARVPKNQSSPVGWQWNNLSGSLGEEIEVAWHFKAFDLGPHVFSGADNADLVTNWYSFDMNATLTQTKGSAKPSYYIGSYGPGGVRDSVWFDGVGGHMAITAGKDAFDDDFSLFLVLGEFANVHNVNQPILSKSDKTEPEGALYGRKSNRMRLQDDDANYGYSSATPSEDQIRSVQFDASAGTYAEYVDGTAVSTAGSPSTEFNFDTVGKQECSGITTEYMSGAISEILMFNNYMDEDQRQIIEGYLAYKYALMNSLPSGHPYKTVHPFLEATGTGAFIGSAYMISDNHILCSGAYGDGEDMMVNIDDGDRIEFYVPGCQNPGQITVKLTYSLG